jgi:Uma2 family endonuclease
MATTTALIPIEEYLRTSYHPDVDYIDGHIEERNLGEYDHGLLQAELTIWFGNHRKEWNIRVIPELRTRVSTSRVRIPDICLVPTDGPREQVRTTPPILCIEILSPEDRMARILLRMDDYLHMGVKNLWIIDPVERAAFTYSASGLQLVSADRITIPNSPIYLDLKNLFAELD